MYPPDAWYLIRTKSNREHFVRERLSRVVREVFVPMLRLPSARAGASSPCLVPLFPQYVFARLDLHTHYFEVCYMPGVSGFVCAGREPLPVCESIVDTIRARCTSDVLQFSPRPFCHGERVRLTGGAFRDFDAIFESYLSGARRVAILIETIQGSGLRVIADAAMVVRA